MINLDDIIYEMRTQDNMGCTFPLYHVQEKVIDGDCEYWQFVQIFLCKKHAEEFIDYYQHYPTKELRIHCSSAYISEEMRFIMQHLLGSQIALPEGVEDKLGVYK